jgi:hypothetical protein
MKNIVITICSILASILSAYTIKPKFCIDCKFFRKDDLDNKYGTCVLFPKKNDEHMNDDRYFLVNGIDNRKKQNIEYNFCSTSRHFDTMCGKDGIFYEKK